MAYYAKINNDGLVLNVIVAEESFIQQLPDKQTWIYAGDSSQPSLTSIEDYYLNDHNIFVNEYWRDFYVDGEGEGFQFVSTPVPSFPRNDNEISLFQDYFPLHEETLLSLKMLRSIEIGDLFVDAGCHRGIISIAAEKLGWKNVVAFDRNTENLRLATINAENNKTLFQPFLYEVNEDSKCPTGDAVLLSHVFEDHLTFFEAGFDGPMPKYILLHCPTNENHLTTLISMYTSVGYVVNKTLNIDDYTGIVFSYKGGD